MSAQAPESSFVSAAAVPHARTAARRKRRGMGRWIGLAVLAAVIALIASTIHPGRGALTYSKYVDEVLAEPQRFVGTELRVEGTVQPGSIENHAGSSQYRFSIERNRRAMPVRYVGVVPDSFRDGIGLTARGRLGANGEFVAQELDAKCPSKYEMQAAAARGERMPAGMGLSALPR